MNEACTTVVECSASVTEQCIDNAVYMMQGMIQMKSWRMNTFTMTSSRMEPRWVSICTQMPFAAKLHSRDGVHSSCLLSLHRRQAMQSNIYTVQNTSIP